MPGVKGRSGGAGKKSLARHIAENTYRADRHGPLPTAGLKQPESLLPATLDLSVLELSHEESDMLDKVMTALGGVPPHMSYPLLIMVQNLTMYAQVHAEALAAGPFTSGRLGLTISPQFKARDKALQWLRADFASFALSMSERAALLELAHKAKERNSKPAPGKPLK